MCIWQKFCSPNLAFTVSKLLLWTKPNLLTSRFSTYNVYSLKQSTVLSCATYKFWAHLIFSYMLAYNSNRHLPPALFYFIDAIWVIWVNFLFSWISHRSRRAGHLFHRKGRFKQQWNKDENRHTITYPTNSAQKQ